MTGSIASWIGVKFFGKIFLRNKKSEHRCSLEFTIFDLKKIITDFFLLVNKKLLEEGKLVLVRHPL